MELIVEFCEREWSPSRRLNPAYAMLTLSQVGCLNPRGEIRAVRSDGVSLLHCISALALAFGSDWRLLCLVAYCVVFAIMNFISYLFVSQRSSLCDDPPINFLHSLTSPCSRRKALLAPASPSNASEP